MPWRLIEAVTLNSTAVGRSAPSPPRCSQFFRPMASGRMACSAGPLSIVRRPSVTPLVRRVRHRFADGRLRQHSRLLLGEPDGERGQDRPGMSLAVHGKVIPGQLPLLRIPLDRVQGADAGQRLMTPLRVRKSGVEEVPTGMRPAPDVGGPGLVHRVVPGVPVGMNEPGKPLEERSRGVPGPADGQVEHGVGVGSVADVHPGVRRPPRGKEGYGGVIGMQGRG